MGEYTERKIPMIAAKETGPGPGRYNLPPTVGFVGHDYTKHSSPAYSFHGRTSHSAYPSDCSPGPRYYVEPCLTRFGRSAGPAYSMLARGKSADNKDMVPGPGVYRPEKSIIPTHKKPPSYSMGSRTRYRSIDQVPAPNTYFLPPVIGPRVPVKGSAPAFSLSGRTHRGGHSEDLAFTPGPAHYNQTDNNSYMKRGPAFSILGRHQTSKAESVLPGPGAHSPEKVAIHKCKAPAYSMGIRHSEYTTPLIIEVPN
ncbi:outer dense fiber protein 3-like protein 2 isoform X2 [Hyla sarda]|uniref:outer dense fiber protein 3-like protein 2 isoform X2 n=1 Tax=Hyla sarda TaxID=327740 RepID=UPI0024C4278B|nr:outer dense fiber protein 3-like protein 2 isoform X2 [Hyla sarda]XP_056374010.1 outer dense fiber protein 3-like protein 2 isoform X2 [Hyla sarda]